MSKGGQEQGGFGQSPMQGGFSPPSMQGGFGQSPMQGGFGQGFSPPSMQGGFGQSPMGGMPQGNLSQVRQGAFGQSPMPQGGAQPAYGGQQAGQLSSGSPSAPSRWDQYNFDPSLNKYLGVTDLMAVHDGPRWEYDPATQSFTSRSFGGHTDTRSLADMQAAAQGPLSPFQQRIISQQNQPLQEYDSSAQNYQDYLRARATGFGSSPQTATQQPPQSTMDALRGYMPPQMATQPMPRQVATQQPPQSTMDALRGYMSPQMATQPMPRQVATQPMPSPTQPRRVARAPKVDPAAAARLRAESADMFAKAKQIGQMGRGSSKKRAAGVQVKGAPNTTQLAPEDARLQAMRRLQRM